MFGRGGDKFQPKTRLGEWDKATMEKAKEILATWTEAYFDASIGRGSDYAVWVHRAGERQKPEEGLFSDYRGYLEGLWDAELGPAMEEKFKLEYGVAIVDKESLGEVDLTFDDSQTKDLRQARIIYEAVHFTVVEELFDRIYSLYYPMD